MRPGAGSASGVGCLWDAAPLTCGMLLDLMRLGFFAFSWLDVFGVFVCVPFWGCISTASGGAFVLQLQV